MLIDCAPGTGCPVIASLQNVNYDTAASPFLYDRRIYRYAKELAGIDKVLFGTDYPLLKPERYRREMADAGLDPTELDDVLGSNAAHLLNL